MKNALDNEYLENKIFFELQRYSEFYRDLSYSTMHFVALGAPTAINIDTYVFSSMEGTLSSIKDILYKGRISDAYALIRKYYDSAIINIYSNLYLDDNFNVDQFIVAKIDNWVKGKDTIPGFETMSKYIIKSPKLSAVTGLIYTSSKFKGSSYDSIRKRCNEYTHFLFYDTLLLNDNEVYLKERLSILNCIAADLRNIFILHISYLFYLNDHYMSSSEYIDCLNAGVSPDEDSKYVVAAFIQEILDDFLKGNRPDIYSVLQNKTTMKLQ